MKRLRCSPSRSGSRSVTWAGRARPTRASMRRTRSTLVPRTIRKRTDSGTKIAMITHSTRGMAPATANRVRHPYTGNRSAAIRPPSTPPSGTHTMVEVTAKLRLRAGVYSATSAAALGRAPPSPNPANNRSAPSCAIDPTTAIKAVARAKTRTLESNAVFRPRRSPASPPNAVPNIMPTWPRARMGARFSLLTCQLCRMAGAARPSDWLSKPSSRMAQPTATSRAFCRRFHGASSISAAISTLRPSGGADNFPDTRVSRFIWLLRCSLAQVSVISNHLD